MRCDLCGHRGGWCDYVVFDRKQVLYNVCEDCLNNAATECRCCAIWYINDVYQGSGGICRFCVRDAAYDRGEFSLTDESDEGVGDSDYSTDHE